MIGSTSHQNQQYSFPPWQSDRRSENKKHLCGRAQEIWLSAPRSFIILHCGTLTLLITEIRCREHFQMIPYVRARTVETR